MPKPKFPILKSSKVKTDWFISVFTLRLISSYLLALFWIIFFSATDHKTDTKYSSVLALYLQQLHIYSNYLRNMHLINQNLLLFSFNCGLYPKPTCIIPFCSGFVWRDNKNFLAPCTNSNTEQNAGAVGLQHDCCFTAAREVSFPK